MGHLHAILGHLQTRLGLGPDTALSLSCILGLGPRDSALPLPTMQWDCVLGGEYHPIQLLPMSFYGTKGPALPTPALSSWDWIHLLLTPHSRIGPLGSVPPLSSMACWDQAVDPAHKAQGSPWLQKSGSRGAVPLLSHCQTSRPMRSSMGQMTRICRPDMGLDLYKISIRLYPCWIL